MIIPNLPVGKMVESDGNPTAVELQFRQNLVQALQGGASQEGLVMPTLTATQNATDVSNQDSQGNNTCAYGTMVYNSTANSIMIAINNGSNQPVFKTVTLT